MNTSVISRKRAQLVLLALIFALPVLIALALNTPWLRLQPSATRNFGTLIQPVVGLADLGLAETGANEGRGIGLWTVLWLPPTTGSCAEPLDLLRRVRLTEGRELERVRVAFSAECTETAATDQLKLSAETSRELRTRTGDSAGAVLVLDPYGNAMMRYPANFDPNHLKKDLARLLRYSKAGKA